jgi:hypothetical protein
MARTFRLVLLLVLGGSIPASAQTYFEHYDQALAHIARAEKLTGAAADSEWRDAERKLLAAKKVGPAPGRQRLRYGSWRQDFLPDYWLGIVYRRTRRPDQAVASLRSTASLITAKAPERSRLDDELRLAQAEVDARLVAASAPASAPVAPPATPPSGVAQKTDPPVVPVRNAGADLLGRARTELQQQRHAAAEQTAQLARAAGADAAQVDAVVHDARVGAAVGALEQELSNRSADGAQREVARLKELAPQHPRLGDFTDRVIVLSRDLQHAKQERDGMLLFYQGHYDRAASVLRLAASTGATSHRVRFYLACSLAAGALAASSSEGPVWQQARGLYRAVPRSAVREDRRYISPSVLLRLEQ